VIAREKFEHYTKCIAVIYRRRSQNYERFGKSVGVFRQYIPKLLQEKLK